jgi:AAA domain
VLDRHRHLAAAFAKLKAARPDEPTNKRNGKDSGEGTDWTLHIASILSGEGYHDALVRLAAKMLTAGTSDGGAVNLLRAIMESAAAPRDDRWEARYADIPRAVSTAREKFQAGEPKAPDDDSDVWDAGDDPGVIQPRGWLSATQFCRQFLSLLIAPGGTGKTALRYLQAIELARETMETITGFKKFQRCKVLIIGLEDGRNEMDRRIEAALICAARSRDWASTSSWSTRSSRRTRSTRTTMRAWTTSASC